MKNMGKTISKKIVVISVFLIIIGLLITLIPWTILPVCEAVDQSSPGAMKMDKSTPMMKCGYTARAETGAGLLITLLGLTLLLFQRKDSRRTGGILATGLGIYVILLPITLTGGVRNSYCILCHRNQAWMDSSGFLNHNNRNNTDHTSG